MWREWGGWVAFSTFHGYKKNWNMSHLGIHLLLLIILLCVGCCHWACWRHRGLGIIPSLTHLITSGSFQVSAYGFITENYRKFSDHYYEHEKKPLVFYANHDMLLESKLWKSLHRVGIMKLYQQWNGLLVLSMWKLSCSTGILCPSSWRFQMGSAVAAACPIRRQTYLWLTATIVERDCCRISHCHHLSGSIKLRIHEW